MKRNAGAVSGDRQLEAEGRSEEVRGGLEQAGEKFKDAFAAPVGAAVRGPDKIARHDPAARLHPPDSDRDRRVEPGALCPRTVGSRGRRWAAALYPRSLVG